MRHLWQVSTPYSFSSKEAVVLCWFPCSRLQASLSPPWARQTPEVAFRLAPGRAVGGRLRICARGVARSTGAGVAQGTAAPGTHRALASFWLVGFPQNGCLLRVRGSGGELHTQTQSELHGCAAVWRHPVPDLFQLGVPGVESTVSSPQTMIKPKLELVGSAKVQPDSPQKGVSFVVIEKATAAERRRGRPKPREKLVQAAPERTRSTRSPLLASAEGCRRAVGAAGAHAPQGAAADELARRRRRCRPPAMWNQKSPRRHPSDSRPVTCGAR